ncbi:uncharacterized protein LOC127738606 [Mytilus californianus]|uniref:uncharacterized protein LOC127738606 n=1 Tax=Mytilus californianus TaxID=6549 RepID=UPI002245501C|nr:uncharacterized protein LOC127738606 [Mytilus californianus]
MDLSLVPEIFIIIFTLIVIVALVLLCMSAQHKCSVTFISILIVEYAFEVLRFLYFVKIYWNRTDFFLFGLPIRSMPTVSMMCSVLLGTIILSSVSFKKSLVKVFCLNYFFLSLILIIIWNNFLATCLIVEHPDQTKQISCESYLEDSNLMDYYQCINDESRSKLHIFNKPRLNTAFYCFENRTPWTSSYFLEFLLLCVPSFAVLYDKLYKTSSFSELKNSPSKETCSICRFNISLFNHTMARALFIIWCVRPAFFLFIASGSFRATSIYIDSFIMISSATFFILVLIDILKFYLFHKIDFMVDNESEYNGVIKNCGQQKEKSLDCEQIEC